MARILVVCIDGTWNANATESGRSTHPTNVELIRRLLVDDGDRQRVIYLSGVGTRGYVDRVVGGLWGSRSKQLIREGYGFLCEHFRPGDRIALFGFSRGAFAVRSIIGVLARIGILRSGQPAHVGNAVSLARSLQTELPELRSFAEAHCHKGMLDVMFVGVWDTVIRYGPILVPFRRALESARRQHLGLFDRIIPGFVRKFCHAIALDECRAAFWPWRASIAEQFPEQVEEMWFVGSHSDVGGGYSDSSLSGLPLLWMAERAAEAGLLLHQLPSVGENSHLAPVNPSRVRLWRMLPARQRTLQDSDRLHESVERRLRAGGYTPVAHLPESILTGLRGK